MRSTKHTQLLILLLTSGAFILATQLFLALHTKYQIICYQLAHEDHLTVLSRELFNWRTLVATVVALAIPTYFLYNTDVISFLKNTMNNYFGSGPQLPSRSVMSRRRWRTNVDDETYKQVMKKGGYIGGLVNDGNTCFMNSVIQSLSSSNTLVNMLENEDTNDVIEAKNLAFMKSLRTLIRKLNHKHLSKGRDYRTNPMLKTMSKTPNKNFLLGYNQEDAQEFFQTILSELESDLKKSHTEEKPADPSSPSSDSEPTTPSSISSASKNGPVYKKDLPADAVFGNEQLGHLGDVYVPANQIDPNLEDADEKVFRYNLLTPVDGLSAERIGCLNCGEMGGIRYSVISGMSLNLPADNTMSIRLTELLNKWIEPEIIEGVNCNRCALNHVLDFQKDKLQSLSEKPNAPQMLIDKLQERIETIQHELEKPIIDDEVVKKLFTDNMMQKSSKSKQILISRPPPLLAMHINRSVFDPMTYRVKKNTAKVVFPLKLDLDPYVAEPSEINTDARLPLSKKVKLAPETPEEDEESSMDLDEKIDEKSPVDSNPETEEDSKTSSDISSDDRDPFSDEQKVRVNANELVSDSDDDSDEEELRITHDTEIPETVEKLDISGPLVYQLRSVIVHYGTHNYGHYIAYRKYRGVWWRTSDENIDIVDEDEVLSAPGTFMLFYELDSLCEELAIDETEVVSETTVAVPEEGAPQADADEEDEEEEEEEEEELGREDMMMKRVTIKADDNDEEETEEFDENDEKLPDEAETTSLTYLNF